MEDRMRLPLAVHGASVQPRRNRARRRRRRGPVPRRGHGTPGGSDAPAAV